jgi:hypothetical protein
MWDKWLKESAERREKYESWMTPFNALVVAIVILWLLGLAFPAFTGLSRSIPEATQLMVQAIQKGWPAGLCLSLMSLALWRPRVGLLPLAFAGLWLLTIYGGATLFPWAGPLSFVLFLLLLMAAAFLAIGLSGWLSENPTTRPLMKSLEKHLESTPRRTID